MAAAPQNETIEEARLRRKKRDLRKNRQRWIKQNLYWLVFAGVSLVGAVGFVAVLLVSWLTAAGDTRWVDRSMRDMEAALEKYRQGDVEGAYRDISDLTVPEQRPAPRGNSAAEPSPSFRLTEAIDQANHWIAEFLVQRRAHIRDPAAMKMVRWHLNDAEVGGDVDAAVALAMIDASQGDTFMAAFRLETVADRRHDVLLPLTWFAIEQARVNRAERTADRAEKEYRKRTKADDDDVMATLGLAEALMLQSRFDEARQVLDGGRATAESRGLLSDARVRVALAEFAEGENRGDAAEDLSRRLVESLRANPRSEILWRLLLKTAAESSPPQKQEIQAFVTEMSKDTSVRSTVLLARARRALWREEFSQAKALAEKAIGAAEDHDEAEHVLAVCLIRAYEAKSFAIENDLDRLSVLPQRVLELVEPLIRAAPARYDFRATRSAALIAKSQSGQALPGLYVASSEFPLDQSIHRNLAMCLLAMNRIDEAEQAQTLLRKRCLPPEAAELANLPKTIAMIDQSEAETTAGGDESIDVMIAMEATSPMKRFHQIAVRLWDVRLAETMDQVSDLDRRGRLGDAPLDEMLLRLMLSRQ